VSSPLVPNRARECSRPRRGRSTSAWASCAGTRDRPTRLGSISARPWRCTARWACNVGSRRPSGHACR